MRKGYPQIESDFYVRMSSLVNLRARLQRNGKVYDGIINKEKHRFYLIDSDNKEIRIKPSDTIKVTGKLEKRIK